MLSAFGLVLLSGLALLPLARPTPLSRGWVVLMAAKAAVFVAALLIFCHVSWRLWPARIFATPAEAPAFQRRFRLAGFSMIVLVGAAFALGVVAHVCG